MDTAPHKHRPYQTVCGAMPWAADARMNAPKLIAFTSLWKG